MESVTQSILVTHDRGDVVLKSWLYQKINPFLQSEGLDARLIERNRIIGDIKKNLADNHAMIMINRSGNYYLLKANEHAGQTANELENDLSKSFTRAKTIIDATAINDLTSGEIRRLTDVSAEVGRLAQMTMREARNVGKDLSQEQITQRKSGTDRLGTDTQEKKEGDAREASLLV